MSERKEFKIWLDQSGISYREDVAWAAWQAAKESSREKLEDLTTSLIAKNLALDVLRCKNAELTKELEELRAKLAMQDEALESAEPVYTTAENSSAVRNGYEVGGSVMHYIIQPYKLHAASNATTSEEVAAWKERIITEAKIEALEDIKQVCVDEENKAWELKGTAAWSSYMEGMSDGAGECADRIEAIRNKLEGEKK